ncbi:hypothetical protein CDL15_Pgr025760 [Punica granatum]|uniref:Uncharacterized protein n=1 Tax=Punica granatum TaxID=22663 RepID=A0A218WCI2_PUNGR|nr:hypothetical protein CDL15_Pgr025760 [Punica granatum]
MALPFLSSSYTCGFSSYCNNRNCIDPQKSEGNRRRATEVRMKQGKRIMASSIARELLQKWGKGHAICPFSALKMSTKIFFGDDPLGKVVVLFMVQMIVMSLASKLVYFLLRPLKQPKFVWNVLAGILISPYITGRKYLLQKKALPGT